MKQKGQVVLLLIIVMTVALAIGLSIVQKSLTDVSTASKVEQSSRAFSAAEAGIESALKDPNGTFNCTNQTDPAKCQSFNENSSAIKQISDSSLIPKPAPGGRQVPLEFPPLDKTEIAQVWLANYNSPSNPPTLYYQQSSLDIYWGTANTTDKAALEVTLIYWDGSKYISKKWYLDQIGAVRSQPNGFEQVASCNSTYTPPGGSVTYQCTKILTSLPSNLMMLRVRLLYNNISQPFAVQAIGTCPSAPCDQYSLPAQARIVKSTGVSGLTQRKIQVFQELKVLSHIFDYAIFSAGDITK